MAEYQDDLMDFEQSAQEQRSELWDKRKERFKNTLKTGGLSYALIIGCVVGAFALNSFLGSDEELPDEDQKVVSGSARVSTSTQEADAANLSLIEQQRKEAAKAEVEAAKEKGESFISQIRLETAEQVEEENLESVQRRSSGTMEPEEIVAGTLLVTTPVSETPSPRKVAGGGGKQNDRTQDSWTLKEEIESAKESASIISTEMSKIQINQSKTPTYVSSTYVSRAETATNSSSVSTVAQGSDDGIPLFYAEDGDIYSDSGNFKGESKRTIRLEQGMKLSAFVTVGYDSDDPGPIEIEIASPPLDGATLISRSPEIRGEKIYAEFTEFSLDGETYPITALMLDASTLRPGYATDVDNHYLARWIPFAIAAFGSGYSDSLKNGTSTVSSDGTVTTENSEISSDQRLKFAGGRMLDKALPILEKQIDRPATLTIDQFSEVGLWILENAKVEVY